MPEAEPVFDHATALHTAVDMLDPEPTLGQRLVRPVLFPRELRAAEFLGWHEDRHLRERERQDAQVLEQSAARGQGRGRCVGQGLIMDTTAVGVTEEENQKQRIDPQDLVYRVVFFLAALTRGLLSSVLGADDPPCRPVMGKREEAGAAAGPASTGAEASSSGVSTVVAAATEAPSRCARTVRERAGASPRVRRAARKAGKRTWSHCLALLCLIPHRCPWTT